MPMTPIPAPPGKKLDWIINNWSAHRVVQPIECEDGYKLSVQASGMHYCTDAKGRREFYFAVASEGPELPFATVEVQASDVPDSWEEYDDIGVYPFVPVETVRALIDSHGGEKGARGGQKDATTPTQLDRIEALLERIAENTAPPTTTLTMTSTTVDPAEMARYLNRNAKETA